jgi:hypothetical protein
MGLCAPSANFQAKAAAAPSTTRAPKRSRDRGRHGSSHEVCSPSASPRTRQRHRWSGLPHPTACAFRFSQPRGALIRPVPAGLVSCRIRSWGCTLQSFAPPAWPYAVSGASPLMTLDETVEPASPISKRRAPDPNAETPEPVVQRRAPSSPSTAAETAGRALQRSMEVLNSEYRRRNAGSRHPAPVHRITGPGAETPRSALQRPTSTRVQGPLPKPRTPFPNARSNAPLRNPPPKRRALRQAPPVPHSEFPPPKRQEPSSGRNTRVRRRSAVPERPPRTPSPRCRNTEDRGPRTETHRV